MSKVLPSVPESLVPPVADSVEPPIVDVVSSRPERRCEGCGCKIDVRGRIIERGDKLKGWLDMEEQVRQAHKDVKTIADQRDILQADLASVRAELSKYKSRGFGEML